MSTPQTLTQAAAPHYSLDYRQRHLISPNQRYLPPPRPSSNLSNSYYPQQNLPARPSSNISVNQQQFAPPPRTHSGMSNGYPHAHSQPRGGAEYPYTNGGLHQPLHDTLDRTSSRGSQHHRQPADPSSTSRAPPAIPAQMPPAQQYNNAREESGERARKRRHKRDVDWVGYFGGKPPTEIITIHDDDSPAPEARAQKPPPPPAHASSTSQHMDKRRRVNGAAGEAPAYADPRATHSYSNGTSTDSLQTTTAPTSLGSQVSGNSRLENTQTGQKRKRTTRTSEHERKKQEVERLGPRGYLAEYGEYIPPPKQHRKQKEVQVPTISDVCMPRFCEGKGQLANLSYSGINPTRKSTTRMGTTSSMRAVRSATTT